MNKIIKHYSFQPHYLKIPKDNAIVVFFESKLTAWDESVLTNAVQQTCVMVINASNLLLK